MDRYKGIWKDVKIDSYKERYKDRYIERLMIFIL